MKRSFTKKQIDLSPQVAQLLAMAQEQQSMMSTYELTLRKLEAESKAKDAETTSFKSQLSESLSSVKAMETRLNSSGSLSILHGVEIRDLTFSHFTQALHYALRCVRSFAKVLAREIELAEWDLDLAVKSIAPRVALQKQSHRIYAVESFVNRVMFAGFNGGSRAREHSWKTRRERFEEFEKLRSSNPKLHLAQNPGSEFGAFLRSKYVNLVHPEMERSLFGNLHQRSAVSSGQLPDTEFFTVFAEMVKRVWLLNLLSMSFHPQVSAFQFAPGCRFSEVYMESVSEEEFVTAETCVGFTVAPGFHVYGTVVQCLVYLSAPPVNRRSTRGQSR
uniref:DUF641 domain-containing protein n=1 Tax=Kalanchoe fedtschenkoi TaxID=63787 RepID=A0A7N0T3X1_KALFE